MSAINLFPVQGVSILYGAALSARNVLFGITFSLVATVQSVSAQTVTIAVLGDSLTHGYGLPAEEGLVSQLQRELDDANADVVLINAGVSGDTTAGGLSRIDWTMTPETDAMIVALGGNDLMRGIDPKQSRENLLQIIERVQAKGLPLLLVGIESSNNFGPEFKAEFDAIYPELAQETGVLLYPDIFAAFRDELTDPAALRKYMQSDAIHPNKDGVALIAEELTPKIIELAEQVRTGE
ncbi:MULTISPECIES: arylesterase [Halocynthiibacter]|uniref:Arylesterase n=1 Tax=Halocynthiibacter halioticoli TaxID=2986804 RepID=A0AAE3J0A6_9RHOB|nr:MULTISPECIES: arylesterase [Halocynthiibacter]MCV6825385.1 arylesterase [Halocynthiibacter halioticoli]MCW4058386.1 arylesterase [Halocynthiibacter sp. SDUM655004]